MTDNSWFNNLLVGEKQMAWEEIKLIDNIGRRVFIDKYGYCELRSIQIAFDGSSCPHQFDRNYFFDKSSKTYSEVRSKSLNFRQIFELTMSKEIFEIKKEFENEHNALVSDCYYRYGHHYETINKEKIQRLSYKSIYLHISYAALGFDGGYFNSKRHYEEVVKITKMSDAEKLVGWYLENSDIKSFKHVVISEIKVKDELFLLDSGKVTVTNVYTFPNKDNLICDVVNSDGETIQIDLKNDSLFYLPYSNLEDEFASLNYSINELELSPYVTNSGNVFNVHWQPINDAARYIVTAYLILHVSGRKNVYHMCDYDVDRNTHFISLPNIVSSGVVFKIKAEVRTGKVIAESRCLHSGFDTSEMK